MKKLTVIGVVGILLGLLVASGYGDAFNAIYLWLGLPTIAVSGVLALLGTGCVEVRSGK